MCHHTMCATTVERMGMEMADTGNNDDEQQWIATMLERLSHSQFRAKFALTDKDRAYARTKGKATHRSSCARNVARPYRRAEPKNDGRQTPWARPSGIHRSACYRHMLPRCIEKWHHLPKGRELAEAEVNRLADLVMAWD